MTDQPRHRCKQCTMTFRIGDRDRGERMRCPDCLMPFWEGHPRPEKRIDGKDCIIVGVTEETARQYADQQSTT